MTPRVEPGAKRPPVRAFSLIELLVVIAMIGVLAAIGLPALKGIGEGNALAAANRQLLDDLSLARLTALNNRAAVSVVFLPAMDPDWLDFYRGNSNAFQTLNNAFDGQLASYAILVERIAGDQPGAPDTQRYVRLWRRLPDGILFAPWSFLTPAEAAQAGLVLDRRLFPFRNAGDRTYDIPFPINTIESVGFNAKPSPTKPGVPRLRFNPMGQLADHEDRILTLVPGSVLVSRGTNNVVIGVDYPPPQRNAERAYEESRILISGLTGRASIEPPVMR